MIRCHRGNLPFVVSRTLLIYFPRYACKIDQHHGAQDSICSDQTGLNGVDMRVVEYISLMF